MKKDNDTNKSFQQIQKDLALIEELETSNKLIRLGFGELQNINPVNDFDFLPFQLLSQGLERLMKSYICIGYLECQGRYPNTEEIKGHDLQILLNKILTHYFDGTSKLILRYDKDFLENDQEFGSVLYILSEFGKRSRYYNFDIITDNAKKSEDIGALWNGLNNALITKLNLWDKLSNPDLQYEIYGDTSRYIISLLESFVAALARQFTMGAIQNEGKSHSVIIRDFSMLWPEDIGKTDYRKDTTRYIHTERHVHKRTAKDELERKFNSQYKSKLIKKAEFEGVWPFYAEEVIVECREKHWCVVTIDGCDYGLNGAAKGRYKLEGPHDAGMAIPGYSIGEFISIALNLWDE